MLKKTKNALNTCVHAWKLLGNTGGSRVAEMGRPSLIEPWLEALASNCASSKLTFSVSRPSSGPITRELPLNHGVRRNEQPFS